MPTEKIIILIQLSLLGTGLILGIIARFFRVEGEPFASFNPKYWKPVWMMKDRYRPPGYELGLIAVLLISIGALWSLIRYLIT